MLSLFRRMALAGAVLLSGAALAQNAQPAPAESPKPRPYSRVVEDKETGALALEMAIREFRRPDGTGPTVFLAGAIHIADQSYYKSLQEFLDRQDVVLFEQVKPAGAGSGDGANEADDSARAEVTEHRLRFLAMALEAYKAKNGAYPKSLAELEAGLEKRFSDLARGAMNDGWGRPVTYEPKAVPEPASDPKPDASMSKGPAPYDLVSLGADGEPGGEGAATDLRFSSQPPLSAAERGDRSEGIQQQLADALGLKFQLGQMDHNRANWRNSDLSIDEVQDRLAKAGADAGPLFSMLDGSSFLGKISGVILKLAAANPQSRVMLKLALMEVLGHADELLGSAPGKMGAMMDVIVNDRNEVVLRDLKRIVETEPGVRTIGVIYGAGHLPGIERSLRSDLGYEPAGDQYVAAIRVTPGEAGMSRDEIASLRNMMSRMVKSQMGMLKSN